MVKNEYGKYPMNPRSQRLVACHGVAGCQQFRLAHCPWLIGAIAIAWISLGGGALGQGRFNRNIAAPQQGALMSPPREVQALVDEARRNIENQQWSEATYAIGLLLGIEDSQQEDNASVDYFIVEDIDAGKQIAAVDSIFKKTIELVESLPEEATKLIELRYGVRAGQLLDKAISDSDWDSLAQVAGRYCFTKSGQDACVIMGEHWLRKGEPRQAARFFEMAFRQKSGLTRLGPELGILTAASYKAAGFNEDAFRCMEATKNQFASASVQAFGSTIEWKNRTTKTKDLVEGLDLGSSRNYERVVKQPHYLGGNPRRNADTLAGIPLPILRWHTELHESKQQKDNLEKDLNDKINEGKSTVIPSRVPINVGPWVITSTYDQRIVAVDTLTGRIGWECFYSGMPLGFSMDRFPTRDSHSLNLTAADYLAKRVWGETAVGMPTSDGERVFSISELPAIDIAESFAAGQNARVAKPQAFRNFNVMQCWSVREEGKLIWEVGGLKSSTEPQLAGVLFLGAPLPHHGELFVIGEMNSDVYLFAIQAQTGKMSWRQPLATNLGSIATDQLRRSVGVVPAADGTIVVCPTLSGYLVGFDSVSKSLLWAFPYRPKIIPGSQNQFSLFGQQESGDYSPFLSRAAEVSVTIHEGVVLFSPSDGEGENVYALSAETGALLWQSDSRNDPVRYVAGAWKDKVIVVNQSSIAALDIETGKELWPALRYPNNAQVVGRGVRNAGAYLLPLSSQEIIQVDLEKGTVVESVKTEKPLGNLVSIGDRLVCASPYELDCYSVREAFQSQLKEELQRSSISRAGLTRQGELALSKGDYDAAISFLEQAKKLEPNNPEVVMLLNKVGLAALTSDFDKYVDRVNLSQDLAYDRDRLPYLRMLAQGLQKQGRYKDAMLKLLELSELRTSQRQDQVAGTDYAVQTPQWTVQEDRWIATQVHRCANQLSPDEWKEIEKAIEERKPKISSGPSNVRRMILEHLASVDALESLRLDSASELIKQGDYFQAERMLVSESRHEGKGGSGVDALRRRDLLAQVYLKLGRFDQALVAMEGDIARLNAVVQNVPGVKLPDLSRMSADPTAVKPAADWPSGRVDASTSFVTQLVIDRSVILESYSTCRWRRRIGDAVRNWSVHYGQGNFLFSNGAGEEVMRCFVPIGNMDKATVPNVYSVDSLILVEMNREIIAINTLGQGNDQSAPQWRESFESNVPEERGRGRSGAIPLNEWGLPQSKGVFRVAAVSRFGLVVLFDDNLICLDLSTGKRVWTVSGFKDAQFAYDGSTLMSFSPRSKAIVHLDLRDGSRKKQIDLKGEMQFVGTVGKYWLMEPASTSRMLHLVDASDGRVVLSKQMSIDTRLTLDGDSGVLALQVSGDVTYWKLSEEKEYVTKAQVEGRVSGLTAHRFGDTILLMPFSTQLQIDSVKVSPPTTDPGFAPLAGRLIALSAVDGTLVWKQNNLVRQFAFPLAQDRTTPFAVFVRRLTLPKVEGVEVDSMSIAVVDTRDGRVVYSKDDLPASRDRGFTQRVRPQDNLISVDYLGANVTLKFLEPEASATEAAPAPQFDFGNIDEKEFRKTIEARMKQKEQ
jgi:outer membrane protein assembly factor BamB